MDCFPKLELKLICGRMEAEEGSVLRVFVLNPPFVLISPERELGVVRGLNCTVQAGGRGKYTLASVPVNKGGDASERTPLACRSRQSLEEQLKKLVQVVDCVCADVQRAQNFYNKLFYR